MRAFKNNPRTFFGNKSALTYLGTGIPGLGGFVVRRVKNPNNVSVFK